MEIWNYNTSEDEENDNGRQARDIKKKRNYKYEKEIKRRNEKRNYLEKRNNLQKLREETLLASK